MDSSSDKQIHYYETFSNAPPSFEIEVSSIIEASEYRYVSSDEDESEISDTNELSTVSSTNLHQIFDMFSLIWCDATVDERAEYQQAQRKFKETFSQLFTFTNITDCQQYLNNPSNRDKIVFIVSNSFARELIPAIHSIQYLMAIYIYCDGQNELDEWSKSYSKIKRIVMEIDQLVQVVEKDQIQRDAAEDQTIFTSFYDANSIGGIDYTHKNLSKENGSFVWSQLYTEALIRMNKQSVVDSRRDIVKLCRERYKNEPSTLREINEFEKTYKRDQAFYWYSKANFLYRPLNRALRQNDVETLFLYRFFLRDLHRQLGKLHESFTEPVLHLYRGQALRKEELEKLEQCQGQIISINSLFSTSRDRNVARTFAEASVTGGIAEQGSEAVIFEITANTKYDMLESRPFGDISRLSNFQEEHEVLFMAGCVFRLDSVESGSEDHPWIVQLRLCSQNEHELKDFYEWLKSCINGTTNLNSLFFILRDMGELDAAERLYLQKLSRSKQFDQNSMLIPLGQIAAEKNEYEKAMNYYEKALDNINRFGGDPRILGVLYTYIGDLHFRRNEFNFAQTAYNEAFPYIISAVDEQHLDTANVYEGLGQTCLAQGETHSALEYLEKCFKIRKRFLPEFHRSFGKLEFLLGETYRSLGDSVAALKHYRLALEVQRKNYHADDIRLRQTEESIRNLQDVNKMS